MKKTSTLIVFGLLAGSLLFPRHLSAQAPEKISYQAVLRNASNQLVTNQEVGMQISILQGTADGSAVYVETQVSATSANGLLSIEIGGEDATVVSGDFSVIAWSDGPYFIKTETDPSGGMDYTITGTSQLLSVPYAFHSRTAEILTGEITESQISDLGSYLTSESDPLFDASPAGGITTGDINEWSSAFLWGDHSSAGYLTEESDPVFSATFDFAGALTGDLLQFDGTKWVKITPDYAAASHNHSANDIASGTLPVARGGTNSTSPGSAGSVAYSTGSGYAFSSAGTSGRLLESGGTGAPVWTSQPTVERINYSTPRTHYATVGESQFLARQGTESVVFGLGNGGAYITGSTTAFGIMAQVPMPVGVVITQVDIGYYDADPDNRINFFVSSHNVLGSGYISHGSVATSTSAGYGYLSITGLSYTLTNTYEIQIRAMAQTNAGTSMNWPGSNLKVTGARVHYRISSAF